MIKFIINVYMTINVGLLIWRLPTSIKFYKFWGYELRDIAFDMVKQVFAGVFIEPHLVYEDKGQFFNEDETFTYTKECESCSIKDTCVDSKYYNH